MDKYIWIELGPYLPEVAESVLIDDSLLLALSVAETIEDDGDEEVQEYQVDQQVIAVEVRIPDTYLPTSHCVIYTIL